ncbi:MAG: hypothetical protein K8R88_03875 [Armatimonadetes bacterium]|nr:hypothetical protein [Armatimonadota bacterium]
MKLFKAGGIASVVATVALAVGVFGYSVSTEIPVGSMEGTAILKKTGKPAKNASIVLTASQADLDRYELEVERRVVRTDENGHFLIRNLPVGSYTSYASTRTAYTDGTPVVIAAGKTTATDLLLLPQEASLSLNVPQHVFLPKETVVMNFTGVSDKNAAKVEVFSIPLEKFEGTKGMQEVLSGLVNVKTLSANPSAGLTSVKKFDAPIDERDEEGTFYQDIKLLDLAEGVYWVQASVSTEGKSQTRGTYIAVSKLALVAKLGKSKTLVQVIDLATGDPVPGADVKRYTASANQKLGKSGPDGTLVLAESSSAHGLGLFATLGKSTAFILTETYAREDSDNIRWHIVTDRPIYRPGDTVHFKGILREKSGEGYRVPSVAPVQIQVDEPDGQTLSKQTVSLGGRGSFSGEFIASEGVVGQYGLKFVFQGKEHYADVNVGAYRKPEFKITVKPLKPRYSKNDTVQMEVRAEHYFGGPVAGAKVSGSVYARQRWGDEGFDYEGEGGYSYSGEYVTQIPEVVTDDEGKAIVAVPASEIYKNSGDPAYSGYAPDKQVTFEITATEGDDKYFDGKGEVAVTQGDDSVDLQTAVYIAEPNQSVGYTVKVRSNDNDAPRAGVPVYIEFGYYNWTNRTAKFVLQGQTTVTTNAEGVATGEIKVPDAQEVLLRATIKDSSGASVQAESNIWVTSQGGGDRPGGSLEIKLDKKMYNVGDSCLAMISTDAPGGSATVTVEAENVTFHKTVPLTGRTASVRIPVDAGMFPNVKVSVYRVRKKQLQEAESDISIAIPDKKLKVTMTPEKTPLRPGDTANYKISVTDQTGKPVQTELALSVVDASIYDIASDQSDPYKSFYPRRYSGVTTIYSFPEVYLDGGDKGGKFADVRTDFRDTAYWDASVVTDANGVATVQVKLPDNLTSWRATATAVSDDTRCGKQTCQVVVQKDLMVRLTLPTMLVNGDKVQVSALVTNNTANALPVDLGIRTEGLKFEGAADAAVTVEPGKTKVVFWTAAPVSSGDFTISAGAKSGALQDALKLPITVLAKGRERIQYESGISNEASKVITVSKDATSRVGSLSIEVSPNLLSIATDSLDSLVDYPYGCVEQTMSRFTPAVVVGKLLRDTNQKRPDLEVKIPKVVRQSLRRLRDLEIPSGGFGWFKHDTPEPEMTALVLDGLARAGEAGVDLNSYKDIVDRSIKWAEDAMKEPIKMLKAGAKKDDYREHLYLAYAVLQHRASAIALEMAEVVKLDEDDVYGLATQALAYEKGGLSEKSLRAAESLDQRLANRADLSSQTNGWMSYGLRTQARCLLALARLKPNSPQIERLIGVIAAMRRGDIWLTTRDTSAVIFALTNWSGFRIATTEQSAPEVFVNGKTVQAMPNRTTIRVALADLQSGENKIEIKQATAGQLFYSVAMMQTPEQKGLLMAEPMEGISISESFHSLETIRLSDGKVQLVPSTNPKTTFKSGQPVRCVIEVNCTQSVGYALIKIPRPSNLFPVDSSDTDWWNFWFSDIQILDDHVAVFARTLQKGVNRFELNFRAESKGTCVVLPAVMQAMYRPDMLVSSAESTIEVRD